MNATANTVSNKPVITIQEPGAKATNAQLRVIGHAVKENQLERFDENAWKNMTKGQAAEIITKLYANHGELPASQAQKTKLGDLIRRGFLKGLKRKTYQNLTSSQAKRMIYKGLQNETANRTVEGYEPREPLVPRAPMTERQSERLTQLVNDGFLSRFNYGFFRKMTHEQASKYISLGKWRQANNQRVEPEVQPAA